MGACIERHFCPFVFALAVAAFFAHRYGPPTPLPLHARAPDALSEGPAWPSPN